MSGLAVPLSLLVKQRLTAAAEEKSGLFEGTIAEYEEELCRSQEENERRRKLLDAVLQPQVQLHRTDVKRHLVSEEDPPELQERSPSPDQEDPPEPPHLKEEQEELWTRQEGEQLPDLQTDETDIQLTVAVMTEDPQSAKTIWTGENTGAELLKTQPGEEICGGPEPEPASSSDPGSHSQPGTRDKMLLTCETESDTGDSSDWGQTCTPQSDSNPLKNDAEPVGDTEGRTEQTSVGQSERPTSPEAEGQPQRHDGKREAEKTCSCSSCCKRSSHIWSQSRTDHVNLCGSG